MLSMLGELIRAWLNAVNAGIKNIKLNIEINQYGSGSRAAIVNTKKPIDNFVDG